MGRQSGRAIAIFIGVLLCALFGLTRPVVANHRTGTYTGTVNTGGTAVATVTFTVAGDLVTSFAVSDAPGDDCPAATLTNMTITNHTFSGRTPSPPPGAVTLRVRNGAFTAGGASGTLRIQQAVVPACDTGQRQWTASTTAATPTPTPTSTPLPPRPAVSGGCLDFKTQAEAQTFFNAHKAGDPFGLDTDGDGQACEGLPLSLATAAPRSSLPRTGVSTPVYGFTGLGLLFAGLSLVTLTHRRNTVGRASEYALPRAMAIGGYPAPLPAAVAVQPRSDRPVVLSSEADYALSGWLPHKSQR